MKKLLPLVLLIVAGHLAWKQWGPSLVASDWTVEQLQAIAAGVKAHEVVMYTTSECPHCHTAKDWLATYGFAFTECNMSIEQRCIGEFNSYHADGTPFLVIRRGGKEHLMRNGFDSEEFLRVLQQ